MTALAPTSRLRAESATLGYGGPPVVVDLSLEIPDGAVTSIIGPNGCGKSTLLRAMGRLLRPDGGAAALDGHAIHRLPTKEVARQVGLLTQQPSPPGGLTVEALVQRGRFPHRSLLRPNSERDAEAVERALELAGMADLRRRPVDELSGGQRQRAWIAMALAQETPLLLLDEPTTYLDLSHAIEVLSLVQRLNAEEGRTVVMVLHDVNEAARVSHHMVAMRGGRIVREGPPETVVEPRLLAELYGAHCSIYRHECVGCPIYVPRGARPWPRTADGVAVPSSSHVAAPPPPSLPLPLSSLSPSAPGIAVDRLRVGYDGRTVLDDLTVSLPAGKVTAIVGPNACGKSTLLRTVARLLAPTAGTASVGEADVRAGARRRLAKDLTLLGQGWTPPSGMRVEDLVALGRTPHRGLAPGWSLADQRAVEAAMARCGVTDLRDREVESLSGGQRQRVWFAMALAQDTPVLLLDEPTTFLDPGAQIELLELARSLNRDEGRTVVMILHDLNLAARYADWVVAMVDGAVTATGTPDQVVTESLLRDVFGIEATVIRDPETDRPLVIPARGENADAPLLLVHQLDAASAPA